MMNSAYVIALKSLWIKEINRFLRIWIQTLVPPVITMSLYFVVFGNLIGSRIGEMSGFSYMSFIVPGLIMMSVITNSYSNVASSFFSAKFQRNVEELLVAPVPNYIIIWGYIGGGVTRGLIVGFMVTCVSLFFVDLQIYNLPVLILSVVCTAVLFSIGGLLNAIFARSFDDISIIPTFILTPLTYLGGVFYSISLLPEFWQGVSHFNPIFYMINAFRYGFLGISDVSLVWSFLVIVAFTVALYSLVSVLLKKGVGIRS
ncbi:MAG: ABC-2 type transport system permease protein [Psychromonas sp.]|jgi:ABC-2 type transport system permease protein|uniref:ABC transporter permease n=1 Tax=Psychromonas sp. TaxID=1884585 RepID=UPI0039E3718A